MFLGKQDVFRAPYHFCIARQQREPASHQRHSIASCLCKARTSSRGISDHLSAMDFLYTYKVHVSLLLIRQVLEDLLASVEISLKKFCTRNLTAHRCSTHSLRSGLASKAALRVETLSKMQISKAWFVNEGLAIQVWEPASMSRTYALNAIALERSQSTFSGMTLSNFYANLTELKSRAQVSNLWILWWSNMLIPLRNDLKVISVAETIPRRHRSKLPQNSQCHLRPWWGSLEPLWKACQKGALHSTSSDYVPSVPSWWALFECSSYLLSALLHTACLSALLIEGMWDQYGSLLGPRKDSSLENWALSPRI